MNELEPDAERSQLVWRGAAGYDGRCLYCDESTDFYFANVEFLRGFVGMGRVVHGILRLIAEQPATQKNVQHRPPGFVERNRAGEIGYPLW
jgi:hypothetical protein